MPVLKKYKTNPAVSFKDEGSDGAVLYNPDTDKCVIVNTVGAAIWLYIEEPKTMEEIVVMIKSSFSEVDREKAEQDFLQFIGSFEEDFINEIS